MRAILETADGTLHMATKFVAAASTGSSAMLSEGIHSTVDAGNGMLLLVGIDRSQRAATAEHPFGHGKELYFWSLIVAVLIFGVGGGVSAYQGIVHILHPEPMGDPAWNYVVLGAAAASLLCAFLFHRCIAQNLTHGQLSLWIGAFALRGCLRLLQGRIREVIVGS